jgi:DNA processing protein
MLNQITLDWFRLFRTNNIGPISFHALYRKFANPTDAIRYVERRHPVATVENVQAEVTATNRHGASILFAYPIYPTALKNIRDAPPFLIAQGNLDLLRKDCIAIVGSRSSSIHGNKIAHLLAQNLVKHDHVVVSGMARGIDRNAHIGAGPHTIAVVAHGIDQVYPAENKDLHADIARNGLLLTEAPIGTAPIAHLFPGRNRIVAGLSVGTVVVEATRHSGSLITAQYALDYGREVFAVPGCPLDPRAYGPNTLIQNGAYLIQNHTDILNQLSGMRRIPIAEPEYTDHPAESDLPKEQILQILSTVPVSIDELHQHLPYPIGALRRSLVELELDGAVVHLAGDRVMRAEVGGTE